MAGCGTTIENGSSKQLDDATIKNIVNDEAVEKDDTYKFYNIKEKLLYQTTYKDKKLTSYGSLRKRGDVNLDSKYLKNYPKAATMSEGGCIDWYLVITYYDFNGNIISQT